MKDFGVRLGIRQYFTVSDVVCDVDIEGEIDQWMGEYASVRRVPPGVRSSNITDLDRTSRLVKGS
jgi:hypothetical protein